MRHEIQYHWRIREHMARAGMKNSRDLVGPLRERGNHPVGVADLPHRRARARTDRIQSPCRAVRHLRYRGR